MLSVREWVATGPLEGGRFVYAAAATALLARLLPVLLKARGQRLRRAL